MSSHYDAIVIGAGVMGASTAMHLASAGMKKVLVLEKGPGVGFGSTGKSSACVRQTYSNVEVCRMAWEGLELFKNWQEFTGLSETKAGFNNIGVLFLMGPDDPSPPEIMKIHQEVGVKSTLLDEAERQYRFPDVDFCSTPLDLEAESHDCAYQLQAIHEHEGGFCDPVGTAEDMLTVARGLGTQVRFKSRVVEILQEGGRVLGVVADMAGNREILHAPVVVNCGGPWSIELNRAAGITLSHRLVPTRNQIVCKRFNETLKGGLPMVADMNDMVYFRPDPTKTQIVLGSLREDEEQEQVENPDQYNDVADAPFREEKLTILHHRIAPFETRGEITSYAGLYTINQDDYHPIIDRSDLEGFFPVCGFSGHGFKLSPVVGTLVAQKVLGQWGRFKSGVPVDFFNDKRKKLVTKWGGVIA